MNTTLDSTTIRRIQRTQRALLSPDDQKSPELWGTAVLREVQELIGADAGVFSIPTKDERAFVSPEYPVDAASDYPFRMVDVLPDVWARQVKLASHPEGDVWAPVRREILRSSYYNEIRVPLRAFNAGGMTALPSGKAGPDTCAQLIVHRQTPGRAQGDRERAIYDLLFPAFEAGCTRMASRGHDPAPDARNLDTLRRGFVLTDLTGRHLHRSTRLREMVRTAPEPEALLGMLRHQAWRLGRTVGTPRLADQVPRPVRFRIGRTRFRVTASLLAPEVPREELRVLVTVDALPPSPAKDALGLTPRQREVALLLARGRSNKAIARELGIRPKTARRHTEDVLHRLGIARRSEVAALLVSAGIAIAD